MNLVEYLKNFDHKEDQIEIELEVPLITEKGKKLKINDKDVLSFILGSKLLSEKEKIRIDKCIRSSVISNLKETSLNGKWCFSLTSDESFSMVEMSSLQKKKKRNNEPTDQNNE